MGSFSKQLQVRRPAAEVLGAALNSLDDPLSKMGFTLQERDPRHVVWTRKAWGLQRLWSEPDRITMSFAQASNGETLVTIAGRAPGRIARQFEELEL
jgi:hypothetical protein